MNDYELERQRTIRENDDLLLSLGLITPAALAAKRATSTSGTFNASFAPVKPAPKPKQVKKVVEPRAPTRVSVRGREKEEEKKERGVGMPLRTFIVPDGDVGSEREVDGSGKGVASARLYSTKRFGNIPGVEVGSWWPLRSGASLASIHGPLVAGISGNGDVGAWSICASGGYEDNQDNGSTFTFTGAGGRDLKGTSSQPKNLRTAAQSFHQSFDHPMNAALYKSWKTGKAVRVLRGYKSSSVWAPVEGYRYDGLYKVVDAKMVRSKATGFNVCTFQFERIPGQPLIPQRDPTETIYVKSPLPPRTPTKSSTQIQAPTPSLTQSSSSPASSPEIAPPSPNTTPETPIRDRSKYMVKRSTPLPPLSGSSSASPSKLQGQKRAREVEVEIASPSPSPAEREREREREREKEPVYIMVEGIKRRVREGAVREVMGGRGRGRRGVEALFYTR